MQEKCKGNSGKILIIALVVAVIIILGLIGYICYDKGIILKQNLKEDNKVEDISDHSKDEEQVVDIHSDLIQNLYSIFRLDKSCYMGIDELNNSNLVKLRVAYENISKQNITSVECSKLELSESAYCGSMNGLMSEAYSNGDMKKFKEYEQQNYTDSISAYLIESKVHQLFGSDYNVYHESFGTGIAVNPSCYFMKYDKDNNLYAQFNCEGGGTCAPSSQELVKASKKGEELYLVTKLTDLNGVQTKATYTFKNDQKNGNYVFVKITKE